MKRLFLFFVWCFLFDGYLLAQENYNLELLANVNDYGNQFYNDIWGYVGKDGTEYAIIGTRRATVIYSLENPRQPIERAFISGTFSPWRDFKDYNHFVYGIADEGEDGLLVIDMNGGPNNITWTFWKPNIFIDNKTITLNKCHNIFIDENGYGYLSGCNSRENNRGVFIIDLFSSPGQPSFISATDDRYSHDNYVRDNRIYSADLSQGFSVIDVTDKLEPITIAQQPTSGFFAHNTWLSDDNRFLFTTDEIANGYVDSYDISDLDNIKFLDRFQPVGGQNKGIFPHNVHYYNNFLVTSWYTEGVIITDASRPDNLIEVGRYDTFLGASGGTEGCWGAYPYLPSGIILVSDINTGLYVFEPTYQQACYLEGTVTDASNGNPIDDAKIQILSLPVKESASNVLGVFKTGQVESGEVEVQFLKPGYQVFKTNATLKNGVVTVLNVQLVPSESITISGTLLNAVTKEPIRNGKVQFENLLYQIESKTNAEGQFTLENVFSERYNIVAGSWGFLSQQIGIDLPIDEIDNQVFELMPGYEDDFLFDFGWNSSTDNATAGFWVRDIPIGTSLSGSTVNPGRDIANDFGEKCYITGNQGLSASFDDIDNGRVFLTSPDILVDDYQAPTLSFSHWFYTGGGATPFDDSLAFYLISGTDTLLVDYFMENTTDWVQSKDYFLEEYINTDNFFKVLFVAGDQRQSGHLVEAGIDGFRVVDGLTSSSSDEKDFAPSATIFPNPFSTTANLNLGDEFHQVDVFDVKGKLVQSFSGRNQLFIGGQLNPGIYFVRVTNENGLQKSLRMVKQ